MWSSLVMTEKRQPTQTVRECANQHGVTDRTVRNWIRKGAVGVVRTPGGGVRILVEVARAEDRGNPMKS